MGEAMRAAEVPTHVDLEKLVSEMPRIITFSTFLAGAMPEGFADDSILAEVFHIIDRNGDGRIDPEDLKILSDDMYPEAERVKMIHEVSSGDKDCLDFDE